MTAISKTVHLLGFKISYTVGDLDDTTTAISGTGELDPEELAALIDELSRVSFEIEQGLA